MKRFYVCLIFLLVSAIALGLSACEYSAERPPSSEDVPPSFSGLHPIEILQGDGIAYRVGVTVTDPEDGELAFTVDSSAVDRDTPGSYTVIYRAVDSAGNVVEERVQVTVKARRVTYEQLWEAVDAAIARRGLASLSPAQLCEELYYAIKADLSYTSDSDKSDWVAEAERGLREGEGDCFTYYAVARAYFERLGVSVLTVQRAPNLLPSTHYWLLVNMGTEDAPAWYHWDVCPHYKEYPLTSILLTDEELLAYNEQVPDYYTFDRSLYPATPTEPYQ